MQAQLTAAEANFDKQLKEQTQSSIARENAVKDACSQQLSTLSSTLEFLNQRVRGKNMVLHGILDSTTTSTPAALERVVKTAFDAAAPGRGPSPVSQSIAAVTHTGKPGIGNRAVLVEYSSSQAKHRAYALSRQLRQQGVHLTDELTPKQQQSLRAMEPDRTALLSRGIRTWYRQGTLYYMNQSVRRECKKGEAVRVPVPQGASTPAATPGPLPRAPHRAPPRASPRGGTQPQGSAPPRPPPRGRSRPRVPNQPLLGPTG